MTYPDATKDDTTVKLGQNDILTKVTVDTKGGYCVQVDSTDSNAKGWSDDDQNGLTRGGTC